MKVIFPNPRISLAWGEIFDKLSILEIKAEKLTGNKAKKNVKRERALFERVVKKPLLFNDDIKRLQKRLLTINRILWQIEDDIREKERKKEFDADFINLARSVYKNNDRRAKIKKKINIILKSEIIEEKSYKKY